MWRARAVRQRAVGRVRALRGSALRSVRAQRLLWASSDGVDERSARRVTRVSESPLVQIINEGIAERAEERTRKIVAALLDLLRSRAMAHERDARSMSNPSSLIGSAELCAALANECRDLTHLIEAEADRLLANKEIVVGPPPIHQVHPRKSDAHRLEAIRKQLRCTTFDIGGPDAALCRALFGLLEIVERLVAKSEARA